MPTTAALLGSIPGWQRIPSGGGPTVWRHKSSGWEVRYEATDPTRPWECYPTGSEMPIGGPFAHFNDAVSAVERRVRMFAPADEVLL